MKKIVIEYRDVPLRVLIMLSVVYIFIIVYKMYNPHVLPYIEEKLKTILIALSIVTALLYIPYGRLFKAMELVVKRITGVEFKISTRFEKILDVFEKIVKYVFSLSLGQKFVLVAIIFLILAAFIVAFGDEVEANRAAILAYYLLVLGVFNLIAEYIMNPEEEVNNNNDLHPKLRATISLVVLSLLMYYTPDVTKRYPYSYLIPLVISFPILFLESKELIKKLKRLRR